MPKQVDSAAQRAWIRGAARRVFARRGVRGTGLGHVARAARMGRSSLYHYYPDKASLVGDLLAETLAAERALFHRCLHWEGPPAERIERLMTACAATFPAWVAAGRMMLDLRLADAAGFGDFFRDACGDFADVVRQGQREGSFAADVDADFAARALVGAVDGLLLQALADRDALPDPDALGAQLRALAARVLSR